MKKHIIAILIIVLILAGVGIGIWLVVRKNNSQNLYQVSVDFSTSEKQSDLTNSIVTAQALYRAGTGSADGKLTALCNALIQMDQIQDDVNTYLIYSSDKKVSSKLKKSFKSLSGERDLLLDEYDKYKTRMSGNISADGNAIHDLYNGMFSSTASYIYKYSDCLTSTINYAFSKVYTMSSMKFTMYSMYISSVRNMLNEVSDYEFSSTFTVNKIDNFISLQNDTISLDTNLVGGEFSYEALRFKHYIVNCDMDTFVANFEKNYPTHIDIETETSNEKLAMYYLKKCFGV